MLRFTKTEASVQKLLDLLRCDNCECTLHHPFTTGVCAHTLCAECCGLSYSKKKEVSGGSNACPLCLIPIRPCDVKPHPQLSSLVLVSRRLAKLLRMPSSVSGDILSLKDVKEETGEETVYGLMENKENVISKDGIDFINNDAYCRVESPSPSPGSRADSKPEQLPKVVNSPIPCSIQFDAQAFVVLHPLKRYTDEKEDEPVSVSSRRKNIIHQSPTSLLSAVTDATTVNEMLPPSLNTDGSCDSIVTRRGSRRSNKEGAVQYLQSPPTARLYVKGAIAPLASPEKTFLSENSAILNLENEPEQSGKQLRNVRQADKPIVGRPPKRTMKERPKSTKLDKPLVESPSSLKHQLRLNSKGESVLHRAAIKNDTIQLKQLLQTGLSGDVRDHAGWTPLHEAALRGHTEAVECLLKGGATCDLPGGPDLETPLHEAVANCNVDCVRALLNGSANPNFANGAGKSPLQVCVDLLANAKSATATTGGRKVGVVKEKAILTALTDIHKLLLDKSAPINTTKGSVDINCVKDATIIDYLVGESSASAIFLERRRLRPLLLGTGLSRLQKSQFARVARLIHARVATEMSPEVTHVITGITASQPGEAKKGTTTSKSKQALNSDTETTSSTELVCPRTLKFLFAVLQGCWVLSFDWIETCSLVKMRVEEEGFEVSGCSTAPTSGASRLSRKAKEAGSTGLLHGLRMCLLGNFEYPTPSRTDLANLAASGGATVYFREISSATRLASLAVSDDPTDSVYSLVDGDETQQPASIKWCESADYVSVDQLIALYDPRGSVSGIPEYLQPEELVRAALARLQLKKGHSMATNPLPPPPILPLPATWLMDCVAEYTIIPVSRANRSVS